MNFLARLRAMARLSSSLEGVATRSRNAVIEADDAARLKRLGDIDGQTARAQSHADELDRLVIDA